MYIKKKPKQYNKIAKDWLEIYQNKIVTKKNARGASESLGT